MKTTNCKPYVGLIDALWGPKIVPVNIIIKDGGIASLEVMWWDETSEVPANRDATVIAALPIHPGLSDVQVGDLLKKIEPLAREFKKEKYARFHVEWDSPPIQEWEITEAGYKLLEKIGKICESYTPAPQCGLTCCEYCREGGFVVKVA